MISFWLNQEQGFIHKTRQVHMKIDFKIKKRYTYNLRHHIYLGAYRLLCEQICSSVIGLLKQGCKARVAAATACALLEVLIYLI